MAAQRPGLTQALGRMDKDFREPKYVDAIARIFCMLAMAVTATCAYFAHDTASPSYMFWGFAILSAAFFLASTIAPRNVRIALVAWLPWF